MEREESVLEKAMLWVPPVILGLFLMNHPEFLTRNSSVLLPLGVVIGLWVVSCYFPELWHSIKGMIPILLVLALLIVGVLYLVFGGGADSFVEFGSKSREQIINNEMY